MSYIAPYIDSTGCHIPTYNDILESLITEYKTIYGSDIYLDNDSQDYQLISAFSLKLYDSFQTLLLIYNNSSPTTAIGSSLDRLVAINGISRKSNGYSSVELVIYGVAGTVLDYASVKDINGYIWQLDPEVIIPVEEEIVVTAICTTPGAIQAAANSVTIINTPTDGWQGVSNMFPATPGSVVEEDSDLRARRQSAVSLPSMTVFDGIIAEISQLTSVSKIKGHENDTGVTVDTLPPHSISVVVVGGEDEDIANIIYKRKTPGSATNGTTSVDVVSSLGVSNIIKFSRPTSVSLTIAISVVKLSTWTDDLIDTIKQNVFSYIENLNINDSVYSGSLYTPIINANPNVSNPSFSPATVTVNGAAKVTIGKFQIATVLLSAITVTEAV